MNIKGIEHTPEFQRRFAKARMDYDAKMESFIFSSVVPIYDININESNGPLGIKGTAAFLSIDGRSFFVTAGHVLQVEDGFQLGTRAINAEPKIEEVVQLPPFWTITPDPQSYSDPDVAFCEVSNDFLPNFQRIRFGTPPTHTVYDVAGFPCEEVSLVEDTKRMHYRLMKIGLEIAPEKYRKYYTVEEIREFNLVLSYSRLDRKLPTLIGISGGPVITATLSGSSISGFTYQGLVTRSGSKNVKLFICTRASFIQDSIRQIYFGGEKVWDFEVIELNYSSS